MSDILLLGGDSLWQADALDGFGAGAETGVQLRLTTKPYAVQDEHGALALRRVRITGYVRSQARARVVPIVDGRRRTEAVQTFTVTSGITGVYQRFSQILYPTVLDSTYGIKKLLRGTEFALEITWTDPATEWHLDSATMGLRSVGVRRRTLRRYASPAAPPTAPDDDFTLSIENDDGSIGAGSYEVVAIRNDGAQGIVADVRMTTQDEGDAYYGLPPEVVPGVYELAIMDPGNWQVGVPNTVTVQATLDGAPLDGASISLLSDSPNGVVASSPAVTSDGEASFTVTPDADGGAFTLTATGSGFPADTLAVSVSNDFTLSIENDDGSLGAGVYELVVQRDDGKPGVDADASFVADESGATYGVGARILVIFDPGDWQVGQQSTVRVTAQANGQPVDGLSISLSSNSPNATVQGSPAVTVDGEALFGVTPDADGGAFQLTATAGGYLSDGLAVTVDNDFTLSIANDDGSLGDGVYQVLVQRGDGAEGVPASILMASQDEGGAVYGAPPAQSGFVVDFDSDFDIAADLNLFDFVGGGVNTDDLGSARIAGGDLILEYKPFTPAGVVAADASSVTFTQDAEDRDDRYTACTLEIVSGPGAGGPKVVSRTPNDSGPRYVGSARRLYLRDTEQWETVPVPGQSIVRINYSGDGVSPDRCVLNQSKGGPWQRLRFYGVMLSNNFKGHPSGVNKFFFTHDAYGFPKPYIYFVGSGLGGFFYPGINTQDEATGARAIHYTSNPPNNYATATEAQARITRGVRFDLEVRWNPGTGNADGILEVEKDGILVLDVRNYSLTSTPGPAGQEIAGGRVDPTWGGRGLTNFIDEAQQIHVDRMTVAYGSP